MRSRSRLIATAVVLLTVASILIPQMAEASEQPHPVKPADPGSSSVISFALPNTPGQRFTPNSRNFARAGLPGSPLLLFLPATGAVPRDYRDFLSSASSLGYHVLALDYWNRGKSVVHTCAGIPECYTAVQQNRFDGSHPSIFSAITPSNSIVDRLRTALSYLRRTDPKGGWARYTTGPRIQWKRIVLAGHSQGGGQSAFIAHEHLVRGVLMFSSPVESDNGVPASWMTTPGKTPASRMYGLVNRNDVYFTNVVGSWTAMGMGTPVSSDDRAARDHAHSIVNGLDLGDPRQSHSRSVDDSTPRTSAGVPILEPTWHWMLQQLL